MDNIILRLLISTVVVSLLILSILLVKKTFSKHLSIQTHYKVWYFLFVPCIGFLFPWKTFHLGEYLSNVINNNPFWKNKDVIPRSEGTTNANMSGESNTNLLHDLTVSIDKTSLDTFYNVFFIVWLIGIIFFTGMIIYSLYQINRLKKASTTIKNKQINDMLARCIKEVGVKRKIKLRESSLLNSPITLGLFRPFIIIPKETRQTFTTNDLKYVFLHELSHQKNKDILVNYAMWFLKTIYWFNPLVWYAFNKMRVDRELACDASVLNLLNEKGHVEYGHTIIHFADNRYTRPYEQFSPGIGGTKKQIKQRILAIASYSKESLHLKWKSKVIYALLGVFVLTLTPLTAVVANTDDVYHFTEKNVVYEDLSTYFDGYDGSFVLFDSSSKQYHIYNQEMSQQRVSPDSTYKIYSALFALEANVITPSNNERDWDGHSHPYKEWNKDQNLSTAMSHSVNWYFQDIDRKLGKEQLQHYFDKINYGNKNLSANLDSYWMESSLKVSPIEQVQLLYELEENKYDFNEDNIQAIEKAIHIDDQSDGHLYGKTGTGTINGIDMNGWFIGFVKKANRTFYFAANIQNEDGQATGNMAAEITTQILHDKNIY
ncbi:BlaR1 family beta-lactam sensor/signal transducer [Virgibacillus sp. MSJ-26]|uniref:BlaR1 family beta-lactam sensor/signal transducer n=1 Tax=Virgibacillus sp. MSJ-26 TaxID=2841522 RepID=UPI001C11FE85|nr:BlaR1 family beta-lactam sensor/signal transducer [Virgibacillus sp. MSJ-26]MBU5465762.1 BlaR1 family beta-lactam sensor/signal transducer [Virgibacillus sp. MSJ-26]